MKAVLENRFLLLPLSAGLDATDLSFPFMPCIPTRLIGSPLPPLTSPTDVIDSTAASGDETKGDLIELAAGGRWEGIICPSRAGGGGGGGGGGGAGTDGTGMAQTEGSDVAGVNKVGGGPGGGGGRRRCTINFIPLSLVRRASLRRWSDITGSPIFLQHNERIY